MYKFFGKPLEAIKSTLTSKIVFVFDTKGEFITDDKIIIEKCINKFPFVELNIPIQKKETKIKKCKKCDFTCANQGDLLAHYRKEHK